MDGIDAGRRCPRQIRLARVALFTQRLQIFQNRFAAGGPGFFVIDLEFDRGIGCGRSAAGLAAEMVAAENHEAQSQIDRARRSADKASGAIFLGHFRFGLGIGFDQRVQRTGESGHRFLERAEADGVGRGAKSGDGCGEIIVARFVAQLLPDIFQIIEQFFPALRTLDDREQTGGFDGGLPATEKAIDDFPGILSTLDIVVEPQPAGL